MKILALSVGTLLILLGVAALAYTFLRTDTPPVPANPGAGGVYFPGTGTGTLGTPGADRQLMLATGEQILVNDFIANGVTFEDPANTGSYYLAGKLDYCLEDGTCPDTKTPAFSILYLEDGQNLIVSLNEEPLRDSRLKAERYLMEALGISRQQMCSLSYTVGTTVSVNEVYGSITNLGFSFCPDAVQLP